ncbi:hypothetical protein Tco_0202586, partial [Tanacetum coccineum]
EVSNFALPVIKKLFHETRDDVTLAKASSQPQSTYEAASTLTEFDKADMPQSEEPVFEVADYDMPQDQERDIGENKDEPRKETASRSEWFKKPTLVQEPTDTDW